MITSGLPAVRGGRKRECDSIQHQHLSVALDTSALGLHRAIKAIYMQAIECKVVLY